VHLISEARSLLARKYVFELEDYDLELKTRDAPMHEREQLRDYLLPFMPKIGGSSVLSWYGDHVFTEDGKVHPYDPIMGLAGMPKPWVASRNGRSAIIHNTVGLQKLLYLSDEEIIPGPYPGYFKTSDVTVGYHVDYDHPHAWRRLHIKDSLSWSDEGWEEYVSCPDFELLIWSAFDEDGYHENIGYVDGYIYWNLSRRKYTL